MLSFVTGVQEYGSKLHCDFADFQAILTSPTSYCILTDRDLSPNGEATAVKQMRTLSHYTRINDREFPNITFR